MTLSGAASLTSDSETSVIARALPSGDGASGSSVGVGASVALNVVATRSYATLGDGTGSGTFTGASDVTLDATGGHGVVTQADQGAAGGVAVTPVLALTLESDQTIAEIETLNGGLDATGAVSVTASQLASALTQASGTAAGGKAAIGAAAAIAVLDEEAIATTSTSVKATGAVGFSASGASLSTTTAFASASGGKPASDAGTSSGGGQSGEDSSVDGKVAKETGGAKAARVRRGVGSADQKSKGILGFVERERPGQDQRRLGGGGGGRLRSRSGLRRFRLTFRWRSGSMRAAR